MTLQIKPNVCVDKWLSNAFFFDIMLLPAAVIVLVLSFTQKRIQLCTKCCNGTPGILVPMDVLLSRGHRLMYIAAFIVTTTAVLSLVNSDDDIPILIGVSRYTKPVSLMLSVMVYVIVYYPIFAAITMNTTTGLALGTIYFWIFIFVYVWTLIPCDDSLHNFVGIMLDSGIVYFPSWICIIYLMISFLIQLAFKLRTSCRRRIDNHESAMNQEPVAYQVEYVNTLLKRRSRRRKSDDIKSKVQGNFTRALIWLYEWTPGFRFSPRLLSSLFVGFICVYTLTYVYFIYSSYIYVAVMNFFQVNLEVPPLQMLEQLGITDTWEIINSIVHMIGFNVTLTPEDIQNGLQVIHYHVNAIFICWLIAIGATIVLCIVHIFNFLKTHKRHLQQIYRGKFRGIKSLSNGSLVAASLRFSGYQVSYMTWGFIIQQFLLFIIMMLLSEVVIIPLIWGYADVWLWPMLKYFGIPLAMSLAIVLIQNLMGRFLFLHNPNRLELDNRRLYFVMVYIFFFYNMIVGLISCLLRIIKSVIFGVWFISRLDYSTLAVLFERFDPGFAAYCGFIAVENAHTHPVMVAFAHQLVKTVHDESFHCTDDYEEVDTEQLDITKAIHVQSPDKVRYTIQAKSNGIQSDRKVGMVPSQLLRYRCASKKARNKWHVVYTLLKNPTLKFSRATNTNYMEVMRNKRRMNITDADAFLTEVMGGMIGIGGLSAVNS